MLRAEVNNQVIPNVGIHAHGHVQSQEGCGLGARYHDHRVDLRWCGIRGDARMNTQQQFKAAQVIAAILGIIGLLAIGTGFGQWLSIQTMISAGCEQEIGVAMSPCQEGMITLNNRATGASLAGVAAVLASGGILVYLRRAVP
jgi:hypothetical protein